MMMLLLPIWKRIEENRSDKLISFWGKMQTLEKAWKPRATYWYVWPRGGDRRGEDPTKPGKAASIAPPDEPT